MAFVCMSNVQIRKILTHYWALWAAKEYNPDSAAKDFQFKWVDRLTHVSHICTSSVFASCKSSDLWFECTSSVIILYTSSKHFLLPLDYSFMCTHPYAALVCRFHGRQDGDRRPGEGAGNKRFQNSNHFLIWKHMENTSSQCESLEEPRVGRLR